MLRMHVPMMLSLRLKPSRTWSFKEALRVRTQVLIMQTERLYCTSRLAMDFTLLTFSDDGRLTSGINIKNGVEYNFCSQS